MERVLVIDDDEELCELVSDLLSDEGFEVEYENDSEEGCGRAVSGGYALVVLDVMMPGMNGFEVLRRIRAADTSIPVMMLTARGEDVDRIVGFELGADDYLPKPFNPRELVTRIQAILRRIRERGAAAHSRGGSAQSRIGVGDVEVDTGTRHVTRGGETVELTNAEYEVLVQLLSAAGLVVRRDDLVRTVLGRELDAFDRSLDVHISHLRKKLGRQAGEVERIRTVRGVGYIYARPTEQGATNGARARGAGVRERG